MTYCIYQHDFAEVRLSPQEGEQIKRWMELEAESRKIGYGPVFDKLIAPRLKAKLADIEKVARWKAGNGHA